MKQILAIILILATLSPVFGQSTNQTVLEQVRETAKTQVATNLNQVMIEILSGTKDAAKEIYGASKEAIHKSIDFVGEQAPDVIKQFLMWRFYRALLGALTFVAIAGFFLFFVYKFKKFELKSREGSDDHANAVAMKWIFSVVAMILLIVGVGTNSFEMVKIKVAPKVYIIEYVVDLVYNNHNQRR